MEPKNIAGGDNDDSEADNDDDQAIAHQLLNMGKQQVQGATDVEQQDMFDAGLTNDNIPIIQVYEPRVLRIWKAYNSSTSPQHEFDCSGHMMATCLIHIVDFCSWARSSEPVLNWITAEIIENADLRPRVRNGLSLLFVYAVAAAKADIVGNTDMFTTMQDPDSGLGIVNRTSLKIYNDNLNYYTFLKCCLSGLILAGMVPENERCNQVIRDELWFYS
jgi:hypothetical protein